MDDEEHMKVVPPDLFVRLRQEMAASRITKLIYSSNETRLPTRSDSTALQGTFYMNLEAERLKEEQGMLDGVNQGAYCY